MKRLVGRAAGLQLHGLLMWHVDSGYDLSLRGVVNPDMERGAVPSAPPEDEGELALAAPAVNYSSTSAVNKDVCCCVNMFTGKHVQLNMFAAKVEC